MLKHCFNDTHGAHTALSVQFKINAGLVVGTSVVIRVLVFEDVVCSLHAHSESG